MQTYKGLTSAEVSESRKKYGTNDLTPPKRESWVKLLLGKFNDPIIKLLLFATLLSLITGYFHGSMVESFGIIIAVLLATILSFLNEYKAGKEFDILNQVNDTIPVKVFRDGKACEIPKNEVVVGDTEPDLEGIIGTTFYFKGLSVGCYFRYQLGGQVFNTSLFEKVENIGTEDVYNNQDKRALYDRWSTTNREAWYKGISLVQTTDKSSRFVMDENTFTGESFNIGYEFPDRICRKLKLGAMNVQMTMSDIFRLSSVRVERGTDYPFARTVSFSVGLTF